MAKGVHFVKKYKIAVIVLAGMLVAIGYLFTRNVIDAKRASIGSMTVSVVEGGVPSNDVPLEAESWFYKVMLALSDPKTINISLASGNEDRTNEYTPWVVDKRVYLKDFDDLSFRVSDEWRYISGGLVFGNILALESDTYFHFGNSGVMFATDSDIEAITGDVKDRYYQRIRYILETEPSREVYVYSNDQGLSSGNIEIKIGEHGSVIGFIGSGSGYVSASVYLDWGDGWRTINGMGLGTYNPQYDIFSSTGNRSTSLFNMVPLPNRDGLKVGLHVTHVGTGKSYFRIWDVPEWW